MFFQNKNIYLRIDSKQKKIYTPDSETGLILANVFKILLFITENIC